MDRVGYAVFRVFLTMFRRASGKVAERIYVTLITLPLPYNKAPFMEQRYICCECLRRCEIPLLR
jgi:hypothetical protein